MKNTRSILVGFCLFGLSIAAWGQNVNRPADSGIPGYLDPRTGTFRPVPLVTGNGSENPPAVPPTYGKIVLNLNATLENTYPTGENYSCGLTASAFDASSGLSFIDSNQVAATKTGNTLSCTVTLTYFWALASPGSDTMMVEYSVNAANAAGGVPIRLANHGVANFIVPVSATTTTYSFYILL